MNKFLQLDFHRLGLGNLNLGQLAQRGPKPGTALLGLAFDGSRLEGVALRRTNGSIEIKQAFVASLSLDPLTAEPELAGREIRKHLDAAGIRERRCAVCLPLNWTLTLAAPMPDLPEADQQSLLQIEAERGFPYGPEALAVASSRFQTPGGGQFATLVAVPRDHVARLEAALQAAQLRPVSFSIGIAALQPPAAEASEGVLALVPGEHHLGLQITCGGGVAVLRTLEGAFEIEGGERRFQAGAVARELRITLGQLPPAVRETLRRVRVFGADNMAEEITEQLDAVAGSLGLRVEQVKTYAPEEFGVKLPLGAAVSAALSLAARRLVGTSSAFEFLPPRISAWQQLTARYSSPRLVTASVTAGAVALVVLFAFFTQQVQLWYWSVKWNGMKARVYELEDMQANIRRYLPWFDESFRSLSILRRLTEAFPEDGTVSAKTVEIRAPATVTCTGTARDQAALLRAQDNLRSVKEIKDVHVEQMRGRSPMQFTLSFQWGAGGGQ